MFLGDFILIGGEILVLVLMNGVVWLFFGIVGKVEFLKSESFELGLFEYFYYIWFVNFCGWKVFEVLLLGYYVEIVRWWY